jgi:hypothetical protein
MPSETELTMMLMANSGMLAAAVCALLGLVWWARRQP